WPRWTKSRPRRRRLDRSLRSYQFPRPSAEGESPMRREPQITFRNVPHEEGLERKGRDLVAKLEGFYGRLLGCRGVVEVPHRKHHRGNRYHVGIDLTLPGCELAVSRDSRAADDLDAVLHAAFDAATRRLEDYVRRRWHDVRRSAEDVRPA